MVEDNYSMVTVGCLMKVFFLKCTYIKKKTPFVLVNCSAMLCAIASFAPW